jgi:hypothetical protein
MRTLNPMLEAHGFDVMPSIYVTELAGFQDSLITQVS